MAKVKKDLGAALAKAKDSRKFEPPVEEPAVSKLEVVASPKPSKGAGEGPKPNPAATREGKKSVAIYMDPEMHVELKILAARKGTTIQELGEQALQRVLEDA